MLMLQRIVIIEGMIVDSVVEHGYIEYLYCTDELSCGLPIASLALYRESSSTRTKTPRKGVTYGVARP